MLKFKQETDELIKIFKDGKEVGQIFTPSGSSGNNVNCIQVCGCTDIFDYWACGVYKGKKDIQMHFGDVKIPGEFASGMSGCMRCFHSPCACDNKEEYTEQEVIEGTKKNCSNPFNVKREAEIIIGQL